MSALIPGLTSGINGGENKYVAIFRFCDILTYPAYFKYVVQNVQTCSIMPTEFLASRSGESWRQAAAALLATAGECR